MSVGFIPNDATSANGMSITVFDLLLYPCVAFLLVLNQLILFRHGLFFKMPPHLQPSDCNMFQDTSSVPLVTFRLN